MQVTISQGTIVDAGDKSFIYSFMYKGHNLQTNSLPRTTVAPVLRNHIKNIILQWEEDRAENSVMVLRKEFEGKDVTIELDK